MSTTLGDEEEGSGDVIFSNISPPPPNPQLQPTPTPQKSKRMKYNTTNNNQESRRISTVVSAYMDSNKSGNTVQPKTTDMSAEDLDEMVDEVMEDYTDDNGNVNTREIIKDSIQSGVEKVEQRIENHYLANLVKHLNASAKKRSMIYTLLIVLLVICTSIAIFFGTKGTMVTGTEQVKDQLNEGTAALEDAINNTQETLIQMDDQGHPLVLDRKTGLVTSSRVVGDPFIAEMKSVSGRNLMCLDIGSVGSLFNDAKTRTPSSITFMNEDGLEEKVIPLDSYYEDNDDSLFFGGPHGGITVLMDTNICNKVVSDMPQDDPQDMQTLGEMPLPDDMPPSDPQDISGELEVVGNATEMDEEEIMEDEEVNDVEYELDIQPALDEALEVMKNSSDEEEDTDLFKRGLRESSSLSVHPMSEGHQGIARVSSLRSSIKSKSTQGTQGQDVKAHLRNMYALAKTVSIDGRKLNDGTSVVICEGTCPLESNVNVALNKPATQSSTLSWEGNTQNQEARWAVDGNRNTHSHTECSGNQWWEVDLGMMYDISRINVVHRTWGSDNVLRRLQNFNIRFYDATRNQVHSIYQGPSIQEKAWSVDASAQYVRIDMPDNSGRVDVTDNCLHLAEVEVFGVPSCDIDGRSDGSAGNLVADSSGNLLLNGIPIASLSLGNGNTLGTAYDAVTTIYDVDEFIIPAGATVYAVGTVKIYSRRALIDGTLDGTGGGYPGGGSSGEPGRSPAGTNGHGSGGGLFDCFGASNFQLHGGAGGGHGGVGGQAMSDSRVIKFPHSLWDMKTFYCSFTTAGVSYDNTLDSLIRHLRPGSGGGAGAAKVNPLVPDTKTFLEGWGGAGGASILLSANELTVDGVIKVNGGDGIGAGSAADAINLSGIYAISEGGGGGAGGSIRLDSCTLTTGSNSKFEANGGRGGGGARGGGGGGGGIVLFKAGTTNNGGMDIQVNKGYEHFFGRRALILDVYVDAESNPSFSRAQDGKAYFVDVRSPDCGENCAPPHPAFTNCFTDQQCASGYICNFWAGGDNKCYSTGLDFNEECATLVVEDGAPTDQEIPLDARCTSGLCRSSDNKCGCKSNSHCSSSEVCHTDNKCYSSALSIEQSCASECYSSALSIEQSCGDALNSRCSSGVCRSTDKKCGCKDNSHCPSNEICYSDNKCYTSELSYGQNCATTSGLHLNARCASGLCRSSDKKCDHSGDAYVQNGSFEGNVPATWTRYTSGGRNGYTVDTLHMNSGSQSIKVTNGGASQWIQLDAPARSTLTISGFSKAVGTSTSLPRVEASVYYADGTKLWGQQATFTGGTHDWEFSEYSFTVPKAVNGIILYALYRDDPAQGTAYFDDVSLTAVFDTTGCTSNSQCPSGKLCDTLRYNQCGPACSTGLTDGGYCCAKSCGRCGGSGCSGLPGGVKKCCTSNIRKSGVWCQDPFQDVCRFK